MQRTLALADHGVQRRPVGKSCPLEISLADRVQRHRINGIDRQDTR
ncbi:MAG: hypothetical protein MO852_13230 [Candidatus Devosia euplotis]|nr:hypothetical protein [Candidatus Devosia euplotis]